MTKARLEAFSDGVIAILITIMVLELRPPEGHGLADLLSHKMVTKFSAYGLSFLLLGIYWTNHHHMFHVVPRVNGAILLGNLHLLFWLSLVPFTTAWMGNNFGKPLPAALYGVSMLMPAVAWTILKFAIIRHQGPHSKLAAAVGRDAKGTASGLLYAASIPLAFVNPGFSYAIFVGVALMWLVPDRRIEKLLEA